jgi:hypothetical protein
MDPTRSNGTQHIPAYADEVNDKEDTMATPNPTSITLLCLMLSVGWIDLIKVTADTVEQPPRPLSHAHARSCYAVMDPLYDATRLAPEPDLKIDAAPWLYGEAELECWRLQVLRDRMAAAKLNVGYPGVFHKALRKVAFRCANRGDQPLPTTLTLRAIGDVAVKCGDRLIYQSAGRDAAHSIDLPTGISAEDSALSVELETQSEPPSILIEHGPLATGKAPWHWSGDGTHWAPAVAFAQTQSGVPPHRLEVPAHTLKPAGKEGELYDFGRELLGRIAFRALGKPAIFVGESTAEARNNDPRHFEQSLALVPDGEGRWISEHPLAFRYLRITGAEATEVECRALFHPTQYRGAFACSDERLTRIWMHSAYTHRICQSDFVLDGIKRDRLPWVDNMILSAAVESYAFGDPELLRRTLTVMGRTADTSDINGIVDYNFLWVVGHDALQRYFADTAYLRREWPRIRTMIGRVASKCDSNGLVRPPQNAWVFIDWVDFDKNTSLQMMWLWAQRAGVRLAERMGDQATAAAWAGRADALEQLLRDRAWDRTKECWTDPDKPVPPSRHAHVLSVVSGLAKAAEYPGILRVLKGSEAEPLNSPSMNYYDILARAQLGEPAAALARLSEVWGAMLDRGASTFWEGYDPNEKGDTAYAFYGRPYGKSLCHAWGAGPVVALPQLILGLRPTVDGWRRFTLEPSLGELKWACATVPTPHGTIEVEVEGGSVNLRVPMGTTAEYRGQEFAGPCSVKLKLDEM